MPQQPTQQQSFRITKDFLVNKACVDGRKWFEESGLEESGRNDWQTVCKELENQGFRDWSEWVRGTVAHHGYDADRDILRNDVSMDVRFIAELFTNML
jgi:hypothetical protein